MLRLPRRALVALLVVALPAVLVAAPLRPGLADSAACTLEPAACGLEPPEISRAAPPVPRKPGAVALPARLGPPVWRPLGPTGHHAAGGLAGKTVYVSAGHGFYYGGGVWSTQRGNTNGIVEDLSNAESVGQHLIEALRLLGAHVVPVREPDLAADSVIVDDAAATFAGTDTPQASTAAGWGAVTLPIASDAVNPFTAGTTQYLVARDAETARAVYATGVPRTGYYNVYVSYAQSANRAADAHYVVRHAGGESHYRVDQRRHGGTWVLLGRYWFAAGAPVAESSVVVVNDSADAASGAVVSLDAVRLGGGVGVIDRGGGALERPMYEHAARYYAQLAGAPATVFNYASADNSDDVGTRSRFAAWDHEDGEDAVFLSWHTNAPDPWRGTSSYTYGPDAPPGPLSHFSGVTGSLELQAAVHGQIIDDLRAAWDPAWTDDGQHTAYFGEINPSHNPEMPSLLVEVAYHDTPADAAALKEPAFRRMVARAMARGVARYFAERDGSTLVLAPDPPTALRLENDGAGGLRASWRPPATAPAGGDAPTSYRVYISREGYAFDDGVEVTGESAPLTGLAVGDARYVRVASLNAGGESLPSEVVGARVGARGAGSVLVVGGFDRLGAAQLPTEDLSAFGLGQVKREWLDRINDGSYAARHGAAIGGAGFSFDGATDEAVAAGDVDLGGYQAVDWFLGEESSADVPLDQTARDAISSYLLAGGRLFVSGSEIGWAMVAKGGADEQAFYGDVLHAAYVGDDAATYAVVPPADGPYAGLADFAFDDTGAGGYDADYPDVLGAGASSTVVLGYGGGAGGAAVAWTGAGGDRGVLFGFPFEVIAGADTRRDVMARTLAYLGVAEPGPPADGGAPPDDGGLLDDAAPGVDAGPDGGEPQGGGDGCGCRAAGAAGAGLALPVVAALALACRARRRGLARRAERAQALNVAPKVRW